MDRHDARIVKRRGLARFTQDAIARRGQRRVMENFQRDVALELFVAREIHRAQPPGAQLLVDRKSGDVRRFRAHGHAGCARLSGQFTDCDRFPLRDRQKIGSLQMRFEQACDLRAQGGIGPARLAEKRFASGFGRLVERRRKDFLRAFRSVVHRRSSFNVAAAPSAAESVQLVPSEIPLVWLLQCGRDRSARNQHRGDRLR